MLIENGQTDTNIKQKLAKFIFERSFILRISIVIFVFLYDNRGEFAAYTVTEAVYVSHSSSE